MNYKELTLEWIDKAEQRVNRMEDVIYRGIANSPEHATTLIKDDLMNLKGILNFIKEKIELN